MNILLAKPAVTNTPLKAAFAALAGFVTGRVAMAAGAQAG
jgi:hypothetical protein